MQFWIIAIALMQIRIRQRIQPDPDLQRGSSRIQIRNFVLYPHVRLNPCLDEHLQVVVERSLVLKQNVQRVIYPLYTATASKGTFKQHCFNLKRLGEGTDLASILLNRLILIYALAISLN